MSARGQRSPRSNLRPPPRCPGRDTNGHAPRGVTCEGTLPQEEKSAPPQGANFSPWCHTVLARGKRNQRSDWSALPGGERVSTCSALTLSQGKTAAPPKVRALRRSATRCPLAVLGAHAPTNGLLRAVPKGSQASTPRRARLRDDAPLQGETAAWPQTSNLLPLTCSESAPLNPTTQDLRPETPHGVANADHKIAHRHPQLRPTHTRYEARPAGDPLGGAYAPSSRGSCFSEAPTHACDHLR